MATPDLSARADLDAVPEWMDGPCSYEDLRACLHSLSWVNRITRAYHPAFDFLRRATAGEAQRPGAGEARRPGPLRIVDLGCGYGDTLRRIERWAAARGLAVELLGVDLNPDAIRAAREATPAGSGIQWLAGDARTLPEAQDADLILTSLVMHHIPEPGIVELMRWMERTARCGWLVCDLHRMPVPYRMFSALMHGPWWHRFIRPDGLASIRRSFRREDWRRIAAAARVADAVLREYRPARLCVERIKGGC
jgi:SAM-dependent methyltransferase